MQFKRAVDDKEVCHIYTCGCCEKTYIRGQGLISCAVMHEPGTCCHYDDKEISLTALSAIKIIISEQ